MRRSLKPPMAVVIATVAAQFLVFDMAHAQKYKTDIPPAITIARQRRDAARDAEVQRRLSGRRDGAEGLRQPRLPARRAGVPDGDAGGVAGRAMRKAMRSFGPDNQTVIIFETLMDSRSLFLTANTESIYAMAWLDLKNGPVVVESPPNTLGLVDDFWFHYVTDLGNAGPDKGKGGKFLFLPPGYKGAVPEGYHVFKSTHLRQLVRHARLSGERRPQARRRQHQAAPAHLSAGAGRQSAGDELRQRLGQGVQHHPRDGLHLLRGGQRGRAGGAERRRSTPRRWDCSPRSASRRASPSRPTRA